MALYVAFTADDWIARHRAHYTGGLTDRWAKPTGTRFRGARRGDVCCIKPESARHIVGWASVVDYVTDHASVVWDLLPRDSGPYSSWRDRAHNTVEHSTDPDPVVASMILEDLVLVPAGEELVLPANLKPTTRQGKRYDEDDPAIAYLMARINDGAALAPAGAASSRPRRRAAASLVTDAYVRRNPGGVRVIAPLHNRFAVRFADWLRSAGYREIEHERDHVDVRFRSKDRSFLAELKVCHGVSARAAIREALGQIIEYNLYGDAERADEWWVVLDEKPSAEDQRYVARLRGESSLPLFVAYETSVAGFTVLR